MLGEPTLGAFHFDGEGSSLVDSKNVGNPQDAMNAMLEPKSASFLVKKAVIIDLKSKDPLSRQPREDEIFNRLFAVHFFPAAQKVRSVWASVGLNATYLSDSA